MDVAVVAQEAFLRGVVEVGSVVDGGDVGRGSAEDLGFPWFMSIWVFEGLEGLRYSHVSR